MTDENPTTETPETPTGEPQTEAPPSGENKVDELPEWARKELTNVRGEAANYRTRLRETEAKLVEAKTPDEVNAAVEEFRLKNAELEQKLIHASVVRTHNLPDDLAALVTGSTEEEMTASAKVLAKYSTPPVPREASGGLTPDSKSEDDGEMDPRTLARRTRR